MFNTEFDKRFRETLRELVAHFRELDSRPTVCLGIPVPVALERTRGITAPKVRGVVTPAIAAVARKEGLATIDFYTPLADRMELLPDTFHPNAEGYRIMAETAKRAILGE